MSENVNNTHPENQPENPETPETENQDTAPETAVRYSSFSFLHLKFHTGRLTGADSARGPPAPAP